MLDVIIMMPQKRITVAACTLFIMLGFVAGGIAKLDRESNLANEALSENTIADTKDVVELPETNYIVKII